MAEASRPPEAVRERADRLSGGRLACAVIFDREFTPEEVRRFLALTSAGEPALAHFWLDGRVIRYECPVDEESRWRLALEILVVKSHRQSSLSRRSPDARTRLGLRPIPR
jgi:hypothetical protein